jgi:hypothetical protein
MGFGVLFGQWGDGEDDDEYAREKQVLESLDVPYGQIDVRRVLEEDGEAQLRYLPIRRGITWLYRGWLLDSDDYEALNEAIGERGDRLLVHPSEYVRTASLPEWAPILGDLTPRSLWTESDDIDEAWDLAEQLGPGPLFVRDYYKSARQAWNRGACVVPAGADRDTFAATCRALLDFHGDRFRGGFVVRRFVALWRLPYEAEGHPIFDEHRVIFWRGKPISWAPYHDVDEVEPLRRAPFPELGELVDSPFFVADVGRLADGGLTVIELNDGGTSQFPAWADPWEIYQSILEHPE